MIKNIALLLILMGAPIFGQSNNDYIEEKKIVKSYYEYYNNWDFDKLLTLYHSSYFKNMKAVMIQSGAKLDDQIDFKEHFKNMLKQGMELRHKSQKEYIKNNTYKILNYEVKKIEDSEEIKDPLQIIVEVSGKSNGVSYKGKMVYILHKEKNEYKIADMGKYEVYQKLLKKQLAP